MKRLTFLIKITSCFFLLVFFLFVAKAQSYQWGNVAMGGGGFVSGIITSKNEQNLMYARTDVGGAYRWNASASRWTPLLDWVSTAETGYMGVLSMAIDPGATNRLYMLVGTSYFNGGKTAILLSQDRGNTFAVVDVTGQFKANGNAMGRQNGERLQVDPNNSNVLYCGTQANGLWRSFDMGHTWSIVGSFPVTTTANGNGVSFVLFDPNSKNGTTTSQTIYAGVSQMGTTNLYVSKNGGSTFSPVSGAPTTFIPQRAAITNGNLYITYGNGAGPNGNSSGTEPMNNGAVWGYKSGVNTWVNVTPAGFTKAFSGISIDPNNGSRLLLSTINTYYTQYVYNGNNVYGDRIFVSTNGGTNWTDIVNGNIILNPNGVTWTGGTNIHWTGCAEFDPFNTAKAWVTSGQGIFSCDNVNTSPTTWKFNVAGLEETVPRDIVSIDGGPLATVIYDYDGFISTNVNNYGPRLGPHVGTETGIAASGQGGNVMLRTGSTQFYSLNQGTAWTQVGLSKGGYGKVAVSANGYAFLHCPEGSSATCRSVDHGTSWNTCSGISITNATPVADISNAQNFYAYNRSTGDFLVSSDRGNSFSVAANIGQWGSQLIRSAPGNAGHVWVPMAGAGLKYTQNYGSSFTTAAGGLTSCSAVGFGKAANGVTYPTVYIWGIVNGVEGLFQSTDKGVSWTRINDNAHEYGGIGNGQFVIGSMNTYGRVYMSTVGRGVVYGEPVGTPSGSAAKTASQTLNPVMEQSNPFSMKLVANPVVTNTLDVLIESEMAQTITINIVAIDGKKIISKMVAVEKGINKIRLADVLNNQPYMYYLSAEATTENKVLAWVKFLKM